MRSWHVTEHGEPKDVLSIRETETPAPGPGQIRIRVGASACNFADVLLCRGEYQVKPLLPFTPGLESCGYVDEVGPGVTADLLATRVVGQTLLPHGGFADFAILEVDTALPVPGFIDAAAAAALHLTYLTAWLGLHRRSCVRRGDTVVVSSAAGGVGSAAAQIALAAGATVIGIVSGPHKKVMAEALGIAHVIDRSEGDVIEQVRSAAPFGVVDIVFDPVGGDAYDEATKFIAFEGTIVVVGFASGTVPQPKLNHALVKNYTIAGLHWSLYWKHYPELVRTAQREIFELYADKKISPSISRSTTMEDIPDVLTDLGAGSTLGKAVMVL